MFYHHSELEIASSLPSHIQECQQWQALLGLEGFTETPPGLQDGGFRLLEDTYLAMPGKSRAYILLQ